MKVPCVYNAQIRHALGRLGRTEDVRVAPDGKRLAIAGFNANRILLLVDGVLKWPKEVFRKVVASTETGELDWSSLTS